MSSNGRMEKAHDPLTLSRVSDAKSIEVRADGIFEMSNQHGGPPSHQMSQEDSVSEKESDKEDDSAVADGATSGPPTQVSATEASGNESSAAASAEGKVHEPQTSPEGEVNTLKSENASLRPGDNADPTCSTEHIPAQEPLNNVSPSPYATSSSTSALDDASDSCESTSAESAPAPGQYENEKTESCTIEESLLMVQQFLIDKIQDNQLSSHAQEIHEFVTLHLSDKQRKLHFPGLVQRIVAHFNNDARARGLDDVSVDVQSSICLLEQTFLTLGRVSPLQDMYTAEEEDMLNQLGVGVLLSSREANDSSQPVVC